MNIILYLQGVVHNWSGRCNSIWFTFVWLRYWRGKFQANILFKFFFEQKIFPDNKMFLFPVTQCSSNPLNFYLMFLTVHHMGRPCTSQCRPYKHKFIKKMLKTSFYTYLIIFINLHIGNFSSFFRYLFIIKKNVELCSKRVAKWALLLFI